MINENNKEIRITLSKSQANWLEKTCKLAKISKSKYISWLLSKSAEEMLKVLKANSNWGNYSDDEIEKIIKCNWLEDNF